MTRSIVSSVDLPRAYCSGSFVLLGRIKAWPGSVKLNKVLIYFFPVFNMHGQWFRKLSMQTLPKKKKKTTPGARGTHDVIPESWIFVYSANLYMLYPPFRLCGVKQWNKITNKKQRRMWEWLWPIFTMPRSAQWENPLKIKVWIFNL
jgi:hypothetical protein